MYVFIGNAVTIMNILLGCNTMQSGKSPLMFQRNILPPSSGLKSKLSKKPARSRQQAEPPTTVFCLLLA
jgi:hypothetical protein